MYIFCWKNTETFKRHMKEMNTFRQSHESAAPVTLAKRAGEAHTSLSGNHSSPIPSANVFQWVNGKKIVVPIWYISLPQGSQN
jgi:hypothetical protein